MTKVCSKCKEEKEAEAFYQQNGKPNGYCKACLYAYSSAWAKKNPEKQRERKRRWQQENYPRLALKRRETHLLNFYNITTQEYDEIYNRQEGKCAICGTHQNSYIRSLALDHNHLTGGLRGLLCPKCNQVLGWGQDKPELFLAAAKYLQSYED